MDEPPLASSDYGFDIYRVNRGSKEEYSWISLAECHKKIFS
jgi:hypothetical protein